MSEVKTYEVRRLNTGDLFTMTKILSAISQDIRSELKSLSSLEKEENKQLFGLMLVESALKHAEGDTKTLLADLVGKTREEFEKEPFNAPLIIIDKLAEQEDLNDFFQQARSLVSKLTGK